MPRSDRMCFGSEQGCWDNTKNLCCTAKGLLILKKYLSYITGALVIATSIWSLITNIHNPIQIIRTIWNIIFGISARQSLQCPGPQRRAR